MKVKCIHQETQAVRSPNGKVTTEVIICKLTGTRCRPINCKARKKAP